MDSTQRSKNKAAVLKAFDTLFNLRDYSAAETFWSPAYVQHSAYIAQGRKGLFELTKGLPPFGELRECFGGGGRRLRDFARTILWSWSSPELDRC